MTKGVLEGDPALSRAANVNDSRGTGRSRDDQPANLFVAIAEMFA